MPAEPPDWCPPTERDSIDFDELLFMRLFCAHVCPKPCWFGAGEPNQGGFRKLESFHNTSSFSHPPLPVPFSLLRADCPQLQSVKDTRSGSRVIASRDQHERQPRPYAPFSGTLSPLDQKEIDFGNGFGAPAHPPGP